MTDDAAEGEVRDWVVRAVKAGKSGELPGALGRLSIEAEKLAKGGLSVEEAAQRAMDENPDLVAEATKLLDDARREDKPVEGTRGKVSMAGYQVHARAVALMQKHPHMDYREAVGATLAEDPSLKQRYAGVQ